MNSLIQYKFYYLLIEHSETNIKNVVWGDVPLIDLLCEMSQPRGVIIVVLLVSVELVLIGMSGQTA